jgi:hypothetical protein
MRTQRNVLDRVELSVGFERRASDIFAAGCNEALFSSSPLEILPLRVRLAPPLPLSRTRSTRRRLDLNESYRFNRFQGQSDAWKSAEMPTVYQAFNLRR